MNSSLLRVKATPSASPRTAGGVVLLFAGLLLAGCSQGDGLERAAIRGKVTVQGSPLVAGRIRFVPMEPQGPAATGAIVQGEYKIPKQQGPVVGKHRVEVEADAGVPPDDEAAFAQWKQQPPPVVAIPPTFNRASTLFTQVENKENEFNVAVP